MLRSLVKRVRNFTNIAFSDKFLLTTNVTISICLSGVGDIIEQQYEKIKGEIDKWDKRRTLHMSISGLTVGVFCHHWYIFLDNKMPGRSFKLVCKKVLIDQTLASPIVIFLFFMTLGTLRRSTKDEIYREIKHKAMTLYLAEWTVWPTAQIINFTILPTKYRVLYDNTISLGYDIYTSAVINAPCKEDPNSISAIVTSKLHMLFDKTLNSSSDNTNKVQIHRDTHISANSLDAAPQIAHCSNDVIR